MGNPVVHWEISGTNGKQLQDFYGGLFDWKIDTSSMEGYGLVDTGGGGINGGIFQAGGPMQPGVMIYVAVDDLQASLDKAVRLGGTALMPPTPIPNVGSFAVFTDPAGNRVGLFKPQQM